MVLLNGASASNGEPRRPVPWCNVLVRRSLPPPCLGAVFWCANSYVAIGPGSASVGTFIAQDYVTLTNAAVSGAVFSMSAVTTLTVSSVQLPWTGALSLSGPGYTTPVYLGIAASFAVLAGSGITNTGPSFMVGDIGSYPTPMTQPQPAGAMCVTPGCGGCHVSWSPSRFHVRLSPPHLFAA